MISAVKTMVTAEAARLMNSDPQRVLKLTKWAIISETINVATPTFSIKTLCFVINSLNCTYLKL
jgi:hypothetical protein